MSDVETNRSSDNVDLATLLKFKFEKNMTYREISAETGIPKSTIYSRFKHFLRYFDPDKVDTWEDKKKNVFSAMEMVTIENMMDKDRLKGASFNNLAYGLRQINEMNRLSRNQSTSNVNLNVELGDQRYQEFLRLQNTSIVNPEKEGKGNNTDGL